jgi:group I intron endonuclease
MKKRYSNPISCVYKITVKNYIYIGSAKIFSKRKYEHLRNLKKQIHSNQILQNIFNKYGESELVFSIIEEVDIEKLIEVEQKYINFYQNNQELKLVNILLVAGSTTGYICTEETKEKKRLSMLGKNKGNKRSPEFLQLQSERQIGRIITKEWRENISKALKGKKSPNKPKRFIKYMENIYTFNEFSKLVKCDLSNLYTTKKEYTEKKYGCKIILQDSEEFPNT